VVSADTGEFAEEKFKTILNHRNGLENGKAASRLAADDLAYYDRQ
jgi:hypothetical protein